MKWLAEVYSLFALSNPLHPDVFPYIRKMESEVVSMTLGMFHGTAEDDKKSEVKSDFCGVMTSGGTESILMAVSGAFFFRAVILFS